MMWQMTLAKADVALTWKWWR